jgi:class 3 adenylate cyclase/tetratricopeptide (TPR) repeat protein
MDLGGWLRGLGLGQYETNFRDNKINADLLPRLTNDDLKDIGVSALGDRLQLLDAIAALVGATPPADIPASPSRSAPPKGPEVSAERRPITVMFCDLVGSTSLAAKLDPEDWRSLVNAYLDEASAAVTGLGGHVLKRLGDGLMVLFGYPRAQENDAERAVRAALAIQLSLAEINARNAGKGTPELVARIGLELGPVVVDASGEVFGEAPNVAARVQALAEAGSVLVTANVQRQVAGLFVAEEKGAHALKGVPAAVALYRIVRASGGGRRSGARALTPLVGREEDLALLMKRWERARSGQGRFVQIVGEPGIGKSRLIEEFHARLGGTPHTWVEWSSSQLLQNTALHPIAEWGRQRFGDSDTPAAQRLADLENTLKLIGLDPAEHAPLLAPVVDIPLPAGRAANLAPDELRRRQLASLIAWVLAGARSQAVALAFEDLHWADPTSLDLMQALAERGHQAPLFILATARPEFRPAWSLRSHHSVISLSPLDRADVALMVGELAARDALSKEVIEGVSERTGGVPLFIEEVTRLLLERGEAGGLQAIPPTLQQSLAARLDRLGEAREVAQIGAVLGQDFSYELLQAVGGVADPALQSALDRLVDADLLFVEGAGRQATYHFKHVLIQDAAYESLLKSRRQALHHRAAEILRDDPERAEAEPEIVAHHFTEAGLDDVAIEWWGKAGDQALRRSAFQEAIAHLGKAIAMADKAAGSASERGAKDALASGQRLKLHTDYGQAVMWSKGFAAEETKAAFARAAELTGNAGESSERLAAYYGQCSGLTTRGEMREAEETARTYLHEAEAAQNGPHAAHARCWLGLALLNQGKLSGAESALEPVLADWRPAPDGGQTVQDWIDPGVFAASLLAWGARTKGDLRRYRELSEQYLMRAAELGHVQTTAHADLMRTFLAVEDRDPAAALLSGERAVAFARERGMDFYVAFGEVWSAWARFRLSLPQADSAELRQAIADYAKTGNRHVLPGFLSLLAECEADAQNLDAASSAIEEALSRASETGQVAYALLHRVRGDILLKRDPVDPALAEDAYKAAIAVANEQGARTYGLQAALALAKLYQSTGRPAEGYAALAPALEGFAPAPEMPEIAEAQALLATLAETEEVKAAIALRERRLHLQTAYGQAVMYAKGFIADETKAAFARATELAANAGDFSERFAAAHGLWTFALVRGELESARRMASAFLREAEDAGRLVEASVARRGLAIISFNLGEFAEARTHCERALAACDPERDRETRERFSEDTGLTAMSWLASTVWQLGEVDRARELMEMANRRAAELGHVPSMAHPLQAKFFLEFQRGDAAAALAAAEALEALSRQHGMANWRAIAQMRVLSARCRLHDPPASATDLPPAFETLAEQGISGGWFSNALLAERALRAQDVDGALARIDEALALARQGEGRSDLPFAHLLRGEILLKRDPANPASTEEAFQTAIEIAREQNARSWGLRAALSLARLYQSTGRLTEAHGVLAPALEGFSPTPEMPEIAEAQALVTGLAQASA